VDTTEIYSRREKSNDLEDLIYIYIYIHTEGGTPIAAQNAVGKLIYNSSWSKT
jgi:hypothetical protein